MRASFLSFLVCGFILTVFICHIVTDGNEWNVSTGMIGFMVVSSFITTIVAFQKEQQMEVQLELHGKIKQKPFELKDNCEGCGANSYTHDKSNKIVCSYCGVKTEYING